MAKKTAQTGASARTEEAPARRRAAAERGADRHHDGNPHVTGRGRYEAVVRLEDVCGKVLLAGWNTGAVGDYDWIGLYPGSELPKDPNRAYHAWAWVAGGVPFLTEKRYDRGWTGAYVAWDFACGRWVYLARTKET